MCVFIGQHTEQLFMSEKYSRGTKNKKQTNKQKTNAHVTSKTFSVSCLVAANPQSVVATHFEKYFQSALNLGPT